MRNSLIIVIEILSSVIIEGIPDLILIKTINHKKRDMHLHISLKRI